MEKICLTCRAFKIDDGDDIGSCQLHPPIPIGDCFMFPGVHPHAWCLDWQPKERPRETKQNGAVAVPEFEQFWAVCPLKVGKKAALKAFQNARDRPRIDVLITAMQLAAQSPQWIRENGKFIPHPATWLNRGQWADVPTETRPTVFEEFLARGSQQAEEGSECE